MVLGLDLDWTVGDIREDMLAQVKESLLVSGAAMARCRAASPSANTWITTSDRHWRKAASLI